MLTVAIPTAAVSRMDGKRRSLFSATTEGGLSAKIGDLGREIVVKNTIWTEYETAREGDYILIGTSTDAAPPDEADEIRQIVQFADTFERLADDFALITGV